MSSATEIRPPTEGERIAAEGIPITLKGEPHQLRMGMRALRYIEDEFDSLQLFLEQLQQTLGKGNIRAICTGMLAGLLHEKPAQMALDAFEEETTALLDEGGSLAEWVFALTRALDQSFPPARPGQNAPKGKGSQKGSRGRAGTSSRR